jgi:hypothetical protein
MRKVFWVESPCSVASCAILVGRFREGLERTAGPPAFRRFEILPLGGQDAPPIRTERPAWWQPAAVIVGHVK